jgi:hypothetical protein
MDKPTVPEVLPIMRAYRDAPGNSVGGNLHIVLDEGNVSNEDVRFCIDRARDRGDLAGVELGELLLRMSKTQRSKLSNLFYSDEPTPTGEAGR